MMGRRLQRTGHLPKNVFLLIAGLEALLPLSEDVVQGLAVGLEVVVGYGEPAR